MKNSKAERVYQRFAQEFPIDPELIAQRMNIEVKKTDLDARNETNLIARSAIDGNQRTVEINVNETFIRQRFAVAHALGHHVLGHVQKGQVLSDTSDSYRMKGTTEDLEANTFALELLMPKDALEMAVFKSGIKSPKALADMFQVSQAAMLMRMKQLRMIEVKQTREVDTVTP